MYIVKPLRLSILRTQLIDFDLNLSVPSKQCERVPGLVRLLILIALIWALPSQAHSSKSPTDEDVLTVVCDSWPPWIIGDVEGNATTGIFIEVTRSILSRMGLKAEFKLYPFGRVLRNIETGSADIALMVSPSEERNQLGIFTRSVLSSSYYLYTSKPLPEQRWSSLSELGNLRIGATTQFNYGKDFEDSVNGKLLAIIWSSTERQSFDLLQKERLDGAILNELTAEWLIWNEVTNDLHKLEPAVFSPSYSLLISHHSKLAKKIDTLNQQIDLMHKYGEINAVIRRYLVSSAEN